MLSRNWFQFDGSDFYIYEVSYSVESDDILASVSGECYIAVDSSAFVILQ